MKILRSLSSLAALLLLLALGLAPAGGRSAAVVAASTSCASSSPSSGSYTATVCFTAPAGGSTVSGVTTVSASVTVSGTSPGVQRMVFYIGGQYMLTDYQSPYTFSLPTDRWVDGTYTLQVGALMRDGFTTKQAAMSLVFSNGVTTPPVNNNLFTPAAGTTPADGSPFIVAAAGDGASGENNASQVVNLIGSVNPNLFLYLGDVYEKGKPVEFYNWYGIPGVNFGRFRSITNPTIGNHEYDAGSAAGYFDFWNNIPNYYSFNAGGWHFVSLNSNSSRIGVSKTSSQYQWLQQDLAANAQSCTIVYYHHPLYNIGPEGPTTAMADIWALLAQYKVSIVLNGHDHDYQRWVPLNGSGQPDANGVTEFVAGGGGHGVQTISKTDSRVAYSNSKNPDALGVLKLALNSNGASFSYLSIKGTVLDSGVIPCSQASADTQPPSTPSGLSASASSATQVDLSWQAAADNVGVAGYTLYRDGSSLATTPARQLTYSDRSVQPGTTYAYAVDAFDQAGNHSAPSDLTSATTPSMPGFLTFVCAADTYVNAASPGSNYGASTTIRVDASPDLHAYHRFTVQGLAGASVARARLKVYANSSSSQGINILTVSDTTWGERTMTYNNAPPLGSVIASSGPVSQSAWVTIDVTPYVTGEGTYSFGLTTPGSTALSFAARETGANAPQLILDLQ